MAGNFLAPKQDWVNWMDSNPYFCSSVWGGCHFDASWRNAAGVLGGVQFSFILLLKGQFGSTDPNFCPCWRNFWHDFIYMRICHVATCAPRAPPGRVGPRRGPGQKRDPSKTEGEQGAKKIKPPGRSPAQGDMDLLGVGGAAAGWCGWGE